MNTENEKVNEVNEIKNEVVVENKKMFRAPVLIIVLLYLIGAFAVSWYIGMKEYDEINGIKDNEEIIDVPNVPKEEKLEIENLYKKEVENVGKMIHKRDYFMIKKAKELGYFD